MKFVDIHPDSRLRNFNFDSYMLSLEAIPILKLDNNIPAPHQQKLDSSSEYSFTHSSLFNLHNHLITDPWLSYTAYYIDSSFTVQKIIYDQQTGKLKQPSPVFKFKRTAERSSGNYNCDIKFINEKYAVLTDGIGNLKIIETGDRQRSDEWKCVQGLKPLGETSHGFIVQDVKFLIENSVRQIHCLLLHIRQNSDVDGKFYHVVEWITLKQVEGAKGWELGGRRTIEGCGHLHYLSFDPKCKGVVYSSDKEMKFVFDDVNEIVKNDEVKPESESNMETDAADPEFNFKWTQNGEDIVVTIKRDPTAQKKDFTVNCTETHLEVSHNGTFLINFDLFAEVEVDMMNWIFEKDSIVVNLVKKDGKLTWSFLTQDGPKMDDDKEFTKPIADLNSQFEECDFGDSDDMQFSMGELTRKSAKL